MQLTQTRAQSRRQIPLFPFYSGQSPLMLSHPACSACPLEIAATSTLVSADLKRNDLCISCTHSTANSSASRPILFLFPIHYYMYTRLLLLTTVSRRWRRRGRRVCLLDQRRCLCCSRLHRGHQLSHQRLLYLPIWGRDDIVRLGNDLSVAATLSDGNTHLVGVLEVEEFRKNV